MNTMEPIVYTPLSIKLPREWVPLIDALARREGHAGRSGWMRGAIQRELEIVGALATNEPEKAA